MLFFWSSAEIVAQLVPAIGDRCSSMLRVWQHALCVAACSVCGSSIGKPQKVRKCFGYRSEDNPLNIIIEVIYLFGILGGCWGFQTLTTHPQSQISCLNWKVVFPPWWSGYRASGGKRQGACMWSVEGKHGHHETLTGGTSWYGWGNQVPELPQQILSTGHHLNPLRYSPVKS